MSTIISGGSNIVTNSTASSLSGSTLELLSYRLSAEVGAEVKLLEDKFNYKWILQLISKNGKVISSVDISYIDIPSAVIDRIELDYANKRVRFYFKNGEYIDCDISDIIAKIDELFEAIEDESERAKAAEEELLNKILSLDLETVGALGKYIRYITQEDGQVTAVTETFDTTINASTEHINAPTTLAVKTAIDAEEAARKEKDTQLEEALAIEKTEREAKDKTLNSKIETETTRAQGIESELSTNLQAEHDRAMLAEATELARAVAAEKVLTDNLNQEILDRSNGKILGEVFPGQCYNLPYYFSVKYNDNSADVSADTVTLDGEKTKKTYTLNIQAAQETTTGNTAGLMTASDATLLRTTLPVNLATETTERKAADKALDERIDSLAAKGRFLSVWNAKKGYPETVPTESPYNYRTGDYYIIGEVWEEHEQSETQYNKRPDGKQFIIETHSTVKETAIIKSNDFYVYDGQESDNWTLLQSTTKTYFFSEIAGNARDNENLKAELGKIDADIAQEIQTRDNGDILKNYRSKIGEQTYRLPYFFSTDYVADKAIVTADTITLDGNGTQEKYSLDVNVATESLAGLESAQDKEWLDKLQSQTPTEGAIRLLGNEAVSGQPYNFTYYYSIEPKDDRITATVNTITLDNNRTLGSYSMDIPAADYVNNKAGLMTSEDAKDVRQDLPNAINQEVSDRTEAINKEVADRNTAIKTAIESLDVDSVGSTGSYLKTISETDGKISAVPQTFETYFNKESASNNNAPTTGAVKEFVDTFGGKIDTISANGTNFPVDTNKNVDIKFKNVDGNNIVLTDSSDANIIINYNTVDNIPIINADLDTLDSSNAIEGTYYRHVGTASEPTEIVVGDTFNTVYFNLNKSIEEVKSYLDSLTYGTYKDLSNIHRFISFDFEESTAGFVPVMAMKTAEGKYKIAIITYQNIIWTEDTGWITSTGGESYIDSNTGKLTVTEGEELFNTYPIDMVDSTTGWNAILISKTPFGASTYTNGTIYKCTDASGPTYSRLAINDDVIAEATTRTNADNTLQSNIDEEAAIRLTNDNTLQANITAEETRATQSETNLQTQIDTEVVARTEAIKTAIESLDAELVGEAGKYLKTIYETDGKIYATAAAFEYATNEEIDALLK